MADNFIDIESLGSVVDTVPTLPGSNAKSPDDVSLQMLLNAEPRSSEFLTKGFMSLCSETTQRISETTSAVTDRVLCKSVTALSRVDRRVGF